MTALRADGFGGQVELKSELIHITRDGWRASGPRRTFLLAHVERIDFKSATSLVNGHIRFVLPGVATKLVSNDPNGVLFAKKSNESFEVLAAVIQRRLDERGALDPSEVERLSPIYREGRDEANRENREAFESEVNGLRRKMLFANYAGHMVDQHGYKYGLGVKRDVAGASAEYESGADRSRPTLTRIGAGALLAGPVGAIAGGMFKKDKTKGYVTIIFRDGATVIIDGPAKDEKKMREFASAVNLIADLDKPDDGTVVAAPVATQETPADQLLKLRELLDAGVLTQEQYDEKSAPLISAL